MMNLSSMKKLVLAAAAAVVLASCGGSKKIAETPEPPAKVLSKTKKIGFLEAGALKKHLEMLFRNF